MFMPYQITAVFFLFLMRLLWGAYETVREIETNRRINRSDGRASILSIGSAVEGGTAALLMFFFGWVLKESSFNTVTVILMALLFLLVAFFHYSKLLSRFIRKSEKT